MALKHLLALAALALIAAAPPNCTGCNFARADLQGRDFTRVNYEGANFASANLRRADFTGATLTGVNFSGADLSDARFEGATCTGCNLRGITISRASRGLFGNCTGCNIGGLDVSGYDLSRSGLIGANMEHLRASGTRFNDARLMGANFRDADLRNADFRGAAVCWHNIWENDGTVVKRETECIDLRGANVTGADFSGTRLCDEKGDSANCSPVDAAMLRAYTHSDLAGAKLP